MAAPITACFKNFDGCLSIGGLKSSNGQQNRGCHAKELKAGSQTGVQSKIAFSLESLIEKTNSNKGIQNTQISL